VLEVGDRLPDGRVQRGPGDETTFAELTADGSVLLVFYLFDWSYLRLDTPAGESIPRRTGRRD
jgi:hypothetical protein